MIIFLEEVGVFAIFIIGSPGPGGGSENLTSVIQGLVVV
jgi:hypothetical protein